MHAKSAKTSCEGSAPLRTSCHSRHLKQADADFDVGVFVCLGIGREGAIGGPEVNERLHRFQGRGLEHVQRRGRQQEVAETAVELLLEVQMVEGLHEVRPIEVGVDAEHLQEDGLAYAREVLGETAPLADPIVRPAEEDRVGDAGVVGERHAGGVGREDLGVVDFARDPALHQRHVLDRGQLDGLETRVEPRIRVVSAAPRSASRAIERATRKTYGPADMRGQVLGLQMLVPSASFAYTTWTKFQRLR